MLIVLAGQLETLTTIETRLVNAAKDSEARLKKAATESEARLEKAAIELEAMRVKNMEESHTIFLAKLLRGSLVSYSVAFVPVTATYNLFGFI